MEDRQRKLFKGLIDIYFSGMDPEDYWTSDRMDFDFHYIASEFNEDADSPFKFPYEEGEGEYVDMESQEIEVLREWMEENNWITFEEEDDYYDNRGNAE